MMSSKIERKKATRKQPIVSCLECRRMKWKCDRQFPCANCRKRGMAGICPNGQSLPTKGNSNQISQEMAQLRSQVTALKTALRRAQEQGFDVDQSRPELLRGMEESSTIGEERDHNGDGEFAHGQLALGVEPGSSSFVGNGGAHYDLSAAVLHQTIDQDLFMSDQLEAAYSPSSVNNQGLALVYFVLAHGAAMDMDLPSCNEVADGFYDLGKSCLSLDPSDSIHLIQAIHLMSRYLSNTFKGPRTALRFWSTLGTAARSAQSIGLHRDGEQWRLTREEVEMRRRVFWEIYSEDVLQSMTQARPKLIDETTIDCKMPLKPADATREEANAWLFHHYKYRLVRILVKVNDVQVYAKPYPYRDILRVHEQLKNFEDELPRALSVEESDIPTTHSFFWQRLTLRSLNIEGYMFLHRPHFARALRDSPQEPLASDFRFSYVAELEGSRQILFCLQNALSSDAARASRFLIFFFHAFTAVVNFAAVVIRASRSSLASAAYDQAEFGLSLFESIPADCRARDDLPLLRNLVQQAKQSLSDSQDRPVVGAINHNILGIGTKLVRQSTKTGERPPVDQARQDVDWFGQPLPTELVDAFLLTDHLPETTAEAGPVMTEEQSQQAEWPPFEWALPVSEPTETYDMQRDLQAFMLNIGLLPEEL